MSSKRITCALSAALLLLLAACGFQPLYGDRAPIQAEEGLARISVGIIENRTGQLLRNALEIRLDPNNKNLPPLYNLQVTLTESITILAVRRDASATRANLNLTANYQLTTPKSEVAIYSGTVRTVNSYDILDAENEFGTLTAQTEARRRAAQDLADQIALRLALALEHHSSAPRPTR